MMATAHNPPRKGTAVKEETIKKKTRQGLAALGAIAALIVVATVGSSEDGRSLLVGLALLGVYALPIIIAVVRKHPQIAPIVLINILAGWTVIGWFVALIWSVASFSRERRGAQRPSQVGEADSP
jgi:hypothetical protein